MARVLIPLPLLDSDPTEVAVSWQVLTGAGVQVVFATEDGTVAASDSLMLTGQGLDLWGAVPVLKKAPVVGRILRAAPAAREAYAQMLRSEEFQNPVRWTEPGEFEGVLLPGGHRARGMRAYLESPVLQDLVVSCFQWGTPVAAICHGVLLAARSIDPSTGVSVLHGRRTTALTWALEGRAAAVTRVTRFWDSGYYRTYPDEVGQPAGYMSVQSEVTRALASPTDFLDTTDPTQAGGRVRDTATDSSAAFVVVDGTYVSARWPGDVHTFAKAFVEVLTSVGAITRS